MKWRLHLIILGILLTAVLPSFAGVTPKDGGTIEALINLHKLIKHKEDDALVKITASLGEQSVITKGAVKFDSTRTKLDSRLNNAYSYVILGAALASTGTSLYQLINEYAQFTSATTKTMFNKPMVAWYYSEAMYACAKDVKELKKLYLTLSAAGANIMRGTMDEKLDLVYAIKDNIDDMRRIIDEAYMWCSCVVMGGFHYDYIWDILNSEVTDAIAEDLIKQWNS